MMKPSNPSSWPASARVAASPGRIEFIGNHTDYNGGDVLGVALNLQVEVTAVPRPDNQLVFSSEGIDTVFEGALDDIRRQEGAASWANYPLGIIKVLEGAGHPLRQGLNLSFRSDLPVGAGLSSSAAIELATLEVICALQGIELDGTRKVLLAQKAENDFVGVPCGMLDQAVSFFGRRDHLVCIDCAMTEFSTVPMPAGLHFHVFNTNHKHSLVDSMYARRHAECREALACIQKSLPDVRHLARAPLGALELLEEGSEVRRRAEHVVREHRRVGACAEALELGDLGAAGDLLFASHASSRDLFGNSIPELDTLVELLEQRRDRGVIGARLTGGGFGGAVMALTTGDFTQALAEEVLADYRARHPRSEAPAWLHVMTGDGTRMTG